MRVFGPGSVSSFLKVALDVVYWILWAVLAVVVLGGLAAMAALPFFPGVVSVDVAEGVPGRSLDLLHQMPAMAGGVAGLGLYVGGLLAIFAKLRKVFETLTAGDPFRPENVGRLRVIAAALAGLELLSYAMRLIAAWVFPHASAPRSATFNPTTWFAVLVIFVLAEVFREGARLRREAELTI